MALIVFSCDERWNSYKELIQIYAEMLPICTQPANMSYYGTICTLLHFDGGKLTYRLIIERIWNLVEHSWIVIHHYKNILIIIN
jgi:hypothetical protein